MPRSTRSNPNPTPAASASQSKPPRARKAPVPKTKKRKITDIPDEESDDDDASGGHMNGVEAGGKTGAGTSGNPAEDLLEGLDSADEDVVPPTVANYGTYKPRFTAEAIKTRLASLPRNNTRPSPEARAELLMLYRDFRKSVLLVAWAAGISEAAADTEMGIGKKKRENSAFNNFCSFAIAALALPTPASGGSDGFTNRNKSLGDLWRECDGLEKAIFPTSMLAALAGVPEFAIDPATSTQSVEVVEPQARKLTAEEEALYRPIYDRMVDTERIAARLGNGARVPSTPASITTALTAFQGFHREHLAPLAHHHNVVYYLLAAHTAPVIGWTREFTSVPKYADWLNMNYKAAGVFGMFAQSQSLSKAIEATKPGVTKRIRTIRSDADVVKLDLAHELNRIFETALGKKTKHGFPKMKNPAAVLKAKGYKFKIHLATTARLSKSDIMVGFLKMTKSDRELWLADIKDERFTLVPTDGAEEDEDEEVDDQDEEVNEDEEVNDEDGPDEE